MARSGTPHRRHPVVLAFVAIFSASLLGGLIAGVAGGTGSAPGPAAGSGPGRGSDRAAARDRAVATPAPAAVRQASRALLRLSDLPSGWVQGAAAAASTGSGWSRPLATCVGVPASVVAARPTKVNSPDFSSADKTLGVQDSVSLYPTAAQARAQFRAMGDAKTPGCMDALGGGALEETIQREAGSGTAVGTVSIAGLSSAVVGPNRTHETGFTVTIPLTAGGQTLTITSTQIDFVAGRVEQQITCNGNGVAFPPTLQAQLVLTALGRLAPRGTGADHATRAGHAGTPGHAPKAAGHATGRPQTPPRHH